MNSSTASSRDSRLVQSTKTIDVFSVLRQHMGKIFLGSVLGIAVAAAYCYFATEIFESSAEILVISKDSALATRSSDGHGDSLAMDAALGDEILATHLHILRSPNIVRGALESGKLFTLPSLLEEVPEEIRGDQVATERSIVGYVIKNLIVERGGEAHTKGAQVLRVELQHTSDVDGANILAGIIASYQDFIRHTVQGVGGEAADLIRQAGNDLEQKVELYDKTYADFARQSPLSLHEGEAINPHVVRLTALEQERSQLQISYANAKARLALVESASSEGHPALQLSMIDSDDVARLNLLLEIEKNAPIAPVSAEYNRMAELAGLVSTQSVKLGPNHPRVVETRAQVDKLKEDLKDMKSFDTIATDDGINATQLASSYAMLLRNDIADFESSLTDIERLISEEMEAARVLVDTELQQRRHYRQLERAESLYDAVVERIADLNLVNNYAGFTNEVLKPVEVGPKVWPSIPLLLVLGAFLGGFLGTGAAFLTEALDRSFRSPADIEGELSAPVLGNVPVMRTAKTKSKDGQLANSLVACHRLNSSDAEAFRKLRAAILYRTQATAHPVIQITSATSGEGASTLVSNLAVSIAQAGHRVLLVDANLRAPALSKMFGLAQSTGLADYLVGDEPIDKTVVSTPVENLFLVPSGKTVENPGELLSYSTFQSFQNLLREDYDYILIDSPAVLEVGDAISIADDSDFVLFALQLTPTARDKARRAVEELQDNGANVIGVVVNQVSKNRRSGGYDSFEYNSELRAATRSNRSAPLASTVR